MDLEPAPEMMVAIDGTDHVYPVITIEPDTVYVAVEPALQIVVGPVIAEAKKVLLTIKLIMTMVDLNIRFITESFLQRYRFSNYCPW